MTVIHQPYEITTSQVLWFRKSFVHISNVYTQFKLWNTKYLQSKLKIVSVEVLWKNKNYFSIKYIDLA